MADVMQMTMSGQMGAIGANGGGGGKPGGLLAEGATGYAAWILAGTKLPDVTDYNGVKKISDGIVTNKVDGFGLFAQKKADGFLKGLTQNLPQATPVGPAEGGGGIEMASVTHADIAPPSSSWAASVSAARDHSAAALG